MKPEGAGRLLVVPCVVQDAAARGQSTDSAKTPLGGERVIETLDCLMCSGRGKFYHLCSNAMVDCPPCGATGKVQRDAAWVSQGERLRAFRLQADLSLREASKRAGVSPADWSSAERGRTDPGPIFAALGQGVA